MAEWFCLTILLTVPELYSVEKSSFALRPQVIIAVLFLEFQCLTPVFSGVQAQVELNRKVIADLAIYEPKTFKSLAALAQRRRQEGFLAALGDGKEPEGIFSRIVHHY